VGSEHYNLVVGGGGLQAGARALLLDAAGCLAGAATLKCVQISCGLYTMIDPVRPAVAGLARGPVRRRGWSDQSAGRHQ
jgi:acyl-coenzyme A thioesterase PaaI-like protein